MMNNRHYTTIEQSKHLLELGLKAESADMYYDEDVSNIPIITPYQDGKYPVAFWKDYPQLRKRIPCWSIGALLKLIHSICIHYTALEEWACIYSIDEFIYRADNKNMTSALYEILTFLLQNNYIKTE